MSSLPLALPEWGLEASRPDLEQMLATVLAGVAPMWIVEEEYIAVPGPIWRITLALPALQGQWAQRRYRYDIASRTLYFAGEQPLSAAEFTAIRRTARRMA